MLTLFFVSKNIQRYVFPSVNLPVDTGARESSSDTTSGETVLLELLDVPWLNAGRTKEDTTAHLQGVVEGLGLGRGFHTVSVEPVHGIHDNSDGQTARSNSLDHFVDLVSVDTEAIESTWR